MYKSRGALAIVIVALFGLWGCSRAPSATSSDATAEKLKTVETKLARLEDDFRAAASARDQLSKKLIAAEEARTAVTSQLDRTTRDLKTKEGELTARIAERDQVTNQYKAFREILRDLLTKGDEGKMETSPMVPIIPTSNSKTEVPIVPIPPPTK